MTQKFSPTGRFVDPVKNSPRIQNIPVRTPEGKAIREALIQEITDDRA